MKVLARVISGVAIAILFAAVQAGAAGTNLLTLSGSPYTENFDGMGTGSSQPPLGWNGGTLTGASTTNGVIANVGSFSASTGNSTTSGNFNFGNSGGSDRSIGSLAASTTTRATQVLFANNTGFTITNLTISYDGEQWRDGGNTTSINSLGLTFSQASTGGLTNFTAVGASFNFSAPKNGSAAATLDGNLAANQVTGIGGNFAVSIANGEVFALRWIDSDDAGSDDALAIDNFSLGYAIIPEPSSMMLVGMGLISVFIIRRRRSK